MLISHKHKFITIDIPKTGSRSLRESLVPLNVIDLHGASKIDAEFYQHDFASRVKKQFSKNKWNWEEYYKWVIIRNPWERYFSFFKYYDSYRKKYLNRDDSINWNEHENNQGEQCVELFTGKDNQTVLKNIILNNPSQDSYYCDQNGEVIVDYIASFENLENEFTLLCNKVNINTPTLKHNNKSKNSLNIRDVYNQKLIDLVSEKESSVIDRFGYIFDTGK